MATEQQIRDIAGLYVAYFDRAPDPAGLQFWIDQLDNGRDFATISQDFATSTEARDIYPFLADPTSVSSTAFVTSIYANLFGRAPDQDGLTFWVNVLDSGAVAPGDMVEAIMLGAQDTTVSGGEVIRDLTTIENKIDCALDWAEQAEAIEGFEFDDAAYAAAREALDGVDDSAESVAAAKQVNDLYFAQFFPTTDHTLWQMEVVVSEAEAAQLITKTEIYWGYNPHEVGLDGVDNTAEPNTNNLSNEGAAAGGIPADAFFGTAANSYEDGYMFAVLGVSIEQIAEIDTESDTFPILDFDSLVDLELTANAGDAGNGGTITFTYSDGSSDDIALGQAYYDLVCKLFFDEEGNTRFFEKEVAAQIPVYLLGDGTTTIDANSNNIVDSDGDNSNGATPIGYVDAYLEGASAVTEDLPIILTPTYNNGSTLENGLTGEDNDTIQAATIDMLHLAFIDGGGGNNTLLIEGKGEFAQPKALNNIQYIEIENLPNIYSTEPIGGEDYPDPIESDSNSNSNTNSNTIGNPASVIDLSTADDLINVTITEGSYTGLGADIGDNPGSLTVTGVSNDATVTFDGGIHNGSINVFTSSTGVDGPTFIFNNVSITAPLNIAQNGASLTFVADGVANTINNINALGTGGGVVDLTITGDARFQVETSLSGFLESDSPVTIDASTNGGGVDLTSTDPEILTFYGSQGDDRLSVASDTDVDNSSGTNFADDARIDITNTAGDNYYSLTTYTLNISEGDGDNNVEMTAENATITAGDGDNYIQGTVAEFSATLGDGDNRLDLNGASSSAAKAITSFSFDDSEERIDIVAGDGDNEINLDLQGGSVVDSNEIDVTEVNITLGDGNNEINIPALPLLSVDPTKQAGSSSGSGDVLSTVTINTGEGDDEIFVGGANITINSGGGDDTLTLVGIDNDFVTQVNSDKEFEASNYGAVIDIDTGSGSATINLGAASNAATNGIDGFIVASEGSVIEGTDITLFVNTHADLRAADLNGITSIVMDDDSVYYSGQGFPGGLGLETGSTSEASSLTLLDTQVSALGADVFSTQGEFFGAQSLLTIVITEDTTLESLIDLAAWNESVKLCFVIEDGVTLTLTAEQLHNYVAPEGIVAAPSNGNFTGQVVITDAGPQFDAYDETYNSDNTSGVGGGSVDEDLTLGNNVTVIFTPDGYERPTPPGPQNLIEWDSDDTPTISETVYPFATDLTIEGDADLTITAPIILGDGFSVDFSDFNGDFTDTSSTDGVETITIANFQALTPSANLTDSNGNALNIPNNGVLEDTDANANGDQLIDNSDWGYLAGNGTSADPVRVDFLMLDGTSVGDCDLGVLDGGIKSSGIQQFVLTGFHDEDAVIQSQAGAFMADVVVCDNTEDLEVLGIQNNRNSMVTFHQVNWGTELLMEGDGYANASDQEKNLGNPDLSEVGHLTANFFEPGANATVRITNQGTELGLSEDAEDGFDPDGERVLDVAGILVNNADRLLIQVEDGDAVINDVTGVDVERVIVTGPEDVTIVVNGVGTPDLVTLSNPSTPAEEKFEGFALTKSEGLDVDDLVSIDASGVAGTFTMVLTDDADLSGVNLTGVDAIVLGDGVELTLNADQAEALQGAIVDDGVGTELNIVELTDQTIDMAAIDVDNIGDVSFSDVDDIEVAAGTNFGDADEVTATAEEGDTRVEMTVAQYESIDGNLVGDEDGFDVTFAFDGFENDTNVNINSIVDGNGNFNGTIDQEIILADIDAEQEFNIIIGDADDLTFKFQGNVDLTDSNFDANTNANLNVNGNTFAELDANAVVTLSAAFIEDVFGSVDGNDADDAADAWSGMAGSTLIVMDLSDENIDFDAIAAAGINVQDIYILDSNAPIIIHDGTTFGGANIITPTAQTGAPEFGTESTSVTMRVDQYQSSSGSITGDSQINLTQLAHNNDSDADFIFDNALVDTSGITAPKGTITLNELDSNGNFNLNANITDRGETIVLNELTDISGFEILLSDGQRIDFATQEQADGTVITEQLDGNLDNPTAVGWLFTTVTGQVDTANYDGDINTLYISEDLVDGANEEDLWTTLASSIEVVKYNEAGIPDVLIAFNRVNTFEALSGITGVTYDDQDEFETTATLTLNLEGNTSIGDVVIADTVGEGAFTALTINSYEDRTSLDEDNNFVFQPNKVGDITLSAPVASNTEVVVNLSVDEFSEGTKTNGVDEDGDGGGDRDGLDLEIGTINLGDPGDFSTMRINVAGDANGNEDITIEDINMNDVDLTQVNIDLGDFNGNGEFFLGGEGQFELFEDDMNQNDLDGIVMIQNLIADEDTDLNDGIGPDILLYVRGGANDIKEVGAAPADFNIDGVYFTEDTTLTLTAAQVAAIGIDEDANGVALNWVIEPGVNVTVNICDLEGQELNLDAIEAAGINIGKITVGDGATADESIELHENTTLGDADEIEIIVGDFNIELEMTAAQFQTSSGVITETNTGTDGETGTVVIDELEAIEVGDPAQVTIDLSNVATSGANTLFLSERSDGTDLAGDGDVIISAASDLGSFGISLWDLNDDANTFATLTPNELAGHTVRLSTEVQADGLIVDILGADGSATLAEANNDGNNLAAADKDEKDTNVVWLFTDITAGSPGLDVSGYSEFLGRIWVYEDLVDAEGGDVDGLFTVDDNGTADFTLAEEIIKRIENLNSIDALLANEGIDQRVEVTAFTLLNNNAEFTIEDPLVSIEDLRIDFGGETFIGDLTIDNILGPVDPNFPNFPGDDEMGTLILNSFLATTTDHYLLPDDFNANTDVLPSDVLYFDGVNEIGDIQSGPTRGELNDIDINLGLTGAEVGADLYVQTIFLSDDDANSVGSIDIDSNANSGGDVLGKAIDATDAEITSVLLDTSGQTGTTTFMGGSPAFRGGPTTENFTLRDTNGNSTVNMGFEFDDNGNAIINLDDNGNPYAGVAGEALSLVDVGDHDGTVNLGYIAQVDGLDFTLDNNGNENGLVTATLGDANVDGNVVGPVLEAGGVWDFDDANTNGNPGMILTIEETDPEMFGAGSVRFNQVDEINIVGNVDFRGLLADDANTNEVEGLNIIGDGNTNDNTEIVLAEGATISMTDEQFEQFCDQINISGPGTELRVDAAFLADYGSTDLTEIRGLTALDIEAGSTVTLTPEQARLATVDGGDAGDLTGITVTIIVDETDEKGAALGALTDDNANVIAANFEDLTDVTGIDEIIMVDADGNANTVDVTVGVTVEEADSLVGNVAKNGNALLAAAGGDIDANGNEVGGGDGNFTDIRGLDLSEADILLLEDEDATIIDLTQLQAITANAGFIAEEDGNGNNPLVLQASGDISDENLDVVDGLIIDGDTTVSLTQAEGFTAIDWDGNANTPGSAVIQDANQAGHTLFVDDLQFDANGNFNANVNVNLNNLISDQNANADQNDNVSDGVDNVVLVVNAVDANGNEADININDVNGNVVTGLIADGNANVTVTINDADLFSNDFDAFEVSGSAQIDQNVTLNLVDYDFTYSGTGSYTNNETDVSGTSSWDGSTASGDISLNLDFDDNNQNDINFTFTGGTGQTTVEILDGNGVGDVLAAGGLITLDGGPGTDDIYIINDDADVDANSMANISNFEILQIGDLDSDDNFNLTEATQFSTLLISDSNSNVNDNVNININGISDDLAEDIIIRSSADGNNIGSLNLSLADDTGGTDDMQITFERGDANSNSIYVDDNGLIVNGVEQITMISALADGVVDANDNFENDVEDLIADDVETLIIEGDVDFNININDNAVALELVDANSFNGDLEIDFNDIASDFDFRGGAMTGDANIDANVNGVDADFDTGDGNDNVNINVLNSVVANDIDVDTAGGDDNVNINDNNANASFDIQLGDGNDVLDIEGGNDAIVNGGNDDDFIVLDDVEGDIDAAGGSGNDLLIIDGNDANSIEVTLGDGVDQFGFHPDTSYSSFNVPAEFSDFDETEDSFILQADVNSNSNDLEFRGNDTGFDVTDEVAFSSTGLPSDTYALGPVRDGNDTLVFEFAFSADRNDGLDANSDGNDLLDEIGATGAAAITVDAGTSGYFVAYDSNDGDAYLFAFSTADANVVGSEIDLFAIVENVGVGDLDASNFDLMFV